MTMISLKSRIISGIIAFIMSTAPFSGIGGTKTARLYVSPDGKSGADGSENAPFATIEEARDAVRSLDRAKYKEIDVIIGKGEYSLTETVELTEKDGGNENCTVRYIAEDGAVINGEVSFTAADFKKAEGEDTDYFYPDVKDSIVMLDLKEFGFTPEDVESMTEKRKDGNNSFLRANGKQMTLARYPNEGEFAHVGEESMINSAKGWEWADLGVDTMFVPFERDHLYTAKYWHDLSRVYIVGRFNDMTFVDDGRVFGFKNSKTAMEVLYTNPLRVMPKAGMPFYWYNIEEELDVPGEYYINDDCVLFYFPTDGFETAAFTLAKADCDVFALDGAEYVSFENITVNGTRRNAIVGTGSHITVDGCTLTNISLDGVNLTGDGNTVKNCTLDGIGQSAVRLTGGDNLELQKSGNIVENNTISHWSEGCGYENPAISVKGCGATVSHNSCLHSSDTAIEYYGAYNVIEYNYCEDTCRFVGDCGVIGSKDTFAHGTVIRFNYVKDAGFTRDTEIDNVGVQGILLGNGQQSIKVYGNAVENVTGCGISLFGGRDNEVYGNITMQCKYGIHYNGCFMIQAYLLDPVGCNRINRDEHTRSSVWQAAFPEMKSYTYYSWGMDFVAECLSPDFNAAPVSKIYSNVYYLDKAVCERPDHPFYIDEYVAEYSGDKVVVPSEYEGTLYKYSSKRESFDMAECVANNQKFLALTTEQFAGIGAK